MGKRVCAAQKDPQGKPGAAGEIAVESPCAGGGGGAPETEAETTKTVLV